MLNGIFWILRSGAFWWDIPERYGPWSTVYKRFDKWSKAGIFEKIYQDLAASADMQDINIDSTCIMAHKASAGVKMRQPHDASIFPKVVANYGQFEKNQCIGITRGGRNSKIHAVVDALGNPIHVQLSSGDVNDSSMAQELLIHIKLKPNETTVLADKAQGSYAFREDFADRYADFCIQPKSNTVDPWYCDWFLHKERHLVECFLNQLKEHPADRYPV